jgi:hypothetical protein
VSFAGRPDFFSADRGASPSSIAFTFRNRVRRFHSFHNYSH